MRDDELIRMFPDVGCRWEFVALGDASMWDERKSECDLDDVAARRKKNGELVGEIRQLWLWGDESRTHRLARRERPAIMEHWRRPEYVDNV